MPDQAPVSEYQVPVSGGGSLWCWDTGGEGEPVVLLHPGSGSGESWPYQQPVLAAAGFRVVGYSRRGAYGSVAGTKADADTASGDLDTLADRLGLGRFHLSGSAAGGPVAIDYALSYGDRLRSLTVSGSVMGVQDAEYAELTAALQPDPFGDLPADFKELGPSYRGGDRDGVTAWGRSTNAPGPPTPSPSPSRTRSPGRPWRPSPCPCNSSPETPTCTARRPSCASTPVTCGTSRHMSSARPATTRTGSSRPRGTGY
ncbi:alpha/beta hydrolase [Streptomyces sp. NBC_00016]|uniref:alpha/beta fold hydrolase n=1 Tax=Streptomyces sp. NBC_00016 TaxID=2975622 RepID=UPI003247CAC2